MGHELLNIERGNLYTFQLYRYLGEAGLQLLEFAAVLRAFANHFRRVEEVLPHAVTGNAQYQELTPLSCAQYYGEFAHKNDTYPLVGPLFTHPNLGISVCLRAILK
jgi:hypothetical protein